jgi:hypothetical protein
MSCMVDRSALTDDGARDQDLFTMQGMQDMQTWLGWRPGVATTSRPINPACPA